MVAAAGLLVFWTALMFAFPGPDGPFSKPDRSFVMDARKEIDRLADEKKKAREAAKAKAAVKPAAPAATAAPPKPPESKPPESKPPESKAGEKK